MSRSTYAQLLSRCEHAPRPEASRRALQELEPFFTGSEACGENPSLPGAEALLVLLGASPAARGYLQQYPFLIGVLLRDRHLHAPLSRKTLSAAARGETVDSHAVGAAWLTNLFEMDVAAGEAELAGLPRWRAMRGVVWLRCVARELSGHTSAVETGEELADLAEVLLTALWEALRTADEDASGPWATADGEQVGVVVLAQGKLGARDLNVSSDVDIQLICARWDGTSEELPIAPVLARLSRLCRRFVALCGEHDPSGWLFRVDLDLRPFGRSGAILNGRAAIEHYYETDAAPWERLALLRARPVAGDARVADQLLHHVESYIWPRTRSLEFVTELRTLRRRGLPAQSNDGLDIKRGLGGIRDIELFVQVHQVLGGGSETRLRTQNILEAIGLLRLLGILTLPEARTLRRSYIFLRRLENLLQAQDERQTHRLPYSMEQLDGIAATFAIWGRQHGWSVGEGAALLETAKKVMRGVARLVARLDTPQPSVSSPAYLASPTPRRQRFLTQAVHGDTAAARRDALDALGLDEPTEAEGQLARIMADLPSRLGAEPQVHPPLVESFLNDALACAEPLLALRQLSRLLPKLACHRGFFVLLHQAPLLRRRLLDLLGSSQFLGDLLIHDPELIEWLFWPRLVGASRPQLSDFSKAFHDRLDPMAHDEARMRAWRALILENTLAIGSRYFAQTESFVETLSAMGALVEAAVSSAVALCERICIAPPPKLALIALGRLGHGQQAFGSDVDLVFIAADGSLETRQAAEHFARRLVARLEAPVHGPAPFAIDLRLRPFGSQGALVTTPSQLSAYLREEGRLWEYQAWLKARPIAGVGALGLAAVQQARQALFDAPAPKAWSRQMVQMRRTMRAQAIDGPEVFDIKWAQGGLADIELGTQLMQLVLGRRHRELQEGPLYRVLDALEQLQVMPLPLAPVAETWRLLRHLELATRLSLGTADSRLFVDDASLRRLAVRMGEGKTLPARRLRATIHRSRRLAAHYFRCCVRVAQQEGT